MFDVRGQVTGISGGKVRLYVPNDYFRSNVRLEIAEGADIDVEIDDPIAYTLARKGDKIRVSGRQCLGNQGYATDLEITLGEPLGAAPPPDAKKGHGKGDRSGRAKRGGEGEEPPPAAGEKKGEKKEEKKDADPAAKKDKTKDQDADEAPKAKTKNARKTQTPAKKPAKDADAEAAEEEKK